jgi:hypothetical protein
VRTIVWLARALLCALGLLGQLWVASVVNVAASWWWFPNGAVALAAVAVLGALCNALDVLVLVRFVACAVAIGMLPFFGVGLYYAPVAISVTVAAAIHEEPRERTPADTAKTLLRITIVILVIGVITALSKPVSRGG